MYLTEISNLPSFSPFRSAKKQSGPSNFDLLSRAFDDALLRRLKTTLSPPSISLSWLAKAVDFLALAHSEARSLISRLELDAVDDSLASYLDGTVKLLDLCNSISADIERLRQRRLLLAFALHLLGGGGGGGEFPSPENLRRARKCLSDFDRGDSGSEKRSSKAEALVRGLAVGLRSVPPGKTSSAGKLVRRTVYAVGLVSVFVAGAVVSAMRGSPEKVCVPVPAEFSWGDPLNALNSEVSAELKRRFGGEKMKGQLEEVDDVGARAKEACGVLLVDADKQQQLLNGAVKGLERATASFSEGLERLSDGVNEVFNGVLCNRNHMLEKVRDKNQKRRGVSKR